MLEIEKRSLISEKKYLELKRLFQKEGKLTKHFKRYTIIGVQRSDFVPDEKVEKDLRIRTNGEEALLTLKSGSWHSGEARKEYEIHFDLSEIKDAMGILTELGSPYCVSVYIERYEYLYQNYTVSLDKYFFNNDYIIEFEKLIKSTTTTTDIIKEESKIVAVMKKLDLELIDSKEMINLINKLNFIKKAQHDFTKSSIEEWYKDWEDYIYCRI